MHLQSIEDWKQALKASETQTIMVFKHSTRCGVSRFVLRNVEGELKSVAGKIDQAYFLDLLAHRDISTAIANDTGVEHQSPQLIVMRDKKAIYHASHYEIELANI